MKVNDIVVLKNGLNSFYLVLEMEKHLFEIVEIVGDIARLKSLSTGVEIAVALGNIRLATLKEKYLVDGNVVELENGDVYVVMNDFIVNVHEHNPLTNYNENMENVDIKKLGIKKVYQFINSVYHYNYSSLQSMLYLNNVEHKLIWERTIELTDDEKVILRNLDDKYDTISRNEMGGLRLRFRANNLVYVSFNGYDNLFKSITHESGIHEIKELLK